jgi:hypothetical protein
MSGCRRSIRNTQPKISLDGVLTSTGIAVLRPSSAIESSYLFYWVRHGNEGGGHGIRGQAVVIADLFDSAA